MSVTGKPDSEIMTAYDMGGVSMRYSHFVPRLYNWVCSMGFARGHIMPSRAFCSDESQGYPTILLAKHFAAFPFNHGLVGGVVATDLHGPHAHHGKDMVIVQASHVGYDPDTKQYGVYRRLQTDDQDITTNCGKICGTLSWYSSEYEFACQHIQLVRENGQQRVIVDNQLLDMSREQGLFLNLDKLVKAADGGTSVSEAGSESAAGKVFDIGEAFADYLTDYIWQDDKPSPIGRYLHHDLFYYKRDVNPNPEGRDHLENNLRELMPYIVSAEWPALAAAQVNSQCEFARASQSIAQEPEYQGKKVLFVAGLNVDISPQEGQFFPLTRFVPWAAYMHDESGKQQTWTQSELFELLKAQSTENADQVDLEEAIAMMESLQEIQLPF